MVLVVLFVCVRFPIAGTMWLMRATWRKMIDWAHFFLSHVDSSILFYFAFFLVLQAKIIHNCTIDTSAYITTHPVTSMTATDHDIYFP